VRKQGGSGATRATRGEPVLTAARSVPSFLVTKMYRYRVSIHIKQGTGKISHVAFSLCSASSEASDK
jgi:hypothetical protein